MTGHTLVLSRYFAYIGLLAAVFLILSALVLCYG